RRPPYAIEAEQSVLGAVMLDNAVMDQVGDLISADDFYVGAHRVIFQEIEGMLGRGEPVDPVTLQQALERHAELEAVGGADYLTRLFTTVPSAANAKAYARVVRDKAVLRDLARQATTIVEKVYQTPNRVHELLDDAEARIFAVGEKMDQRRSEYQDVRGILIPVMERIERLMEHQESVTGVSTGFIDLDRMLAGLQPSDLLIVAGRPSMGKTALAMNMAANAALHGGTPTVVFSLEMSKEQLVTRLLASTGMIDAQGLRTGRMRDEDYAKLSHTADLLSKCPLYVDDTPALSVTALRSRARRLKREHKIGLIVVDYLQLMRGSDSNAENRVQEISEISRGLKAVAKELSVPVVALSQLSRQVEQRPDKRPILSDLRESGSIEQDADVVMFVFREEYYKPNDPALTGLAEVIVAKQRNGPTGSVKLTFLHPYTRFDNRAESNEYAHAGVF
ncbi:MAG: replicative DNA helicase, partial [Magnetococcales bacterium]|nr:replicative DNA helicase [Magnetococcales bacterium]